MEYQVNEGTSASLSGVFKTEAGDLLGTDLMEALTATLFDEKSSQVLNSRNQQNILNLNGGTLDASGNFALLFDPEDNTVIDQAVVGAELHILLLEWTYDGGKKGTQDFKIAVHNLPHTP